MSEADKLFEELGYKEKFYLRGMVEAHYVGDDLSIIFLENKEIQIELLDELDCIPQITMQELKAIHKKAQELGWI